jgi:hypothetical protein
MTGENDRRDYGEAGPRVGEISETEIDYNVMGTFPASDPPAWTLGVRRRKIPGEEFEGVEPSVSDPSHQNEPD